MRTGGLLFGAVLVLLLTWVAGMPRYSQPDEHAHMIKMYATSHGEGAGTRITGAPSLVRLMTAPRSLISGTPECYIFQPEVTAGCAVPDADPTLGATTTWVASYPPWYYGLVGILARVLGRDTSVLASRAISAVMCALLIALGLSIFRTRCGERGTAALVALTPTTLSLASAVNPSGLEIAGAFLFWSLLTSIGLSDETPQRRTRTWAGIVAAAVVLVRPIAVPWMLAGLVAILVLERDRFPDRRKLLRSWAPALVALTVSIVASALWGWYADTPLSDSRTREDMPVGSMIRVALGRTIWLGRSAFGVLGWNDTELPTPALLLWLASVGLLAAAVWLVGSPRLRAVLLGFGALWVFAPIAYTTAVRTPHNWAGRYTLPLLGGLAFTALLVPPTALAVTVTRRVSRFVALAFVVIEVASFHQALRRYMVGASGSFTLSSPGWHPPVNAWVLVLGNAAAVALIAFVMSRRSLGTAADNREFHLGTIDAVEPPTPPKAIVTVGLGAKPNGRLRQPRASGSCSRSCVSAMDSRGVSPPSTATNAVGTTVMVTRTSASNTGWVRP